MRLDGEQPKWAGRSPERRSCFTSPSCCASCSPATEEADMTRIDVEIAGGGTVDLRPPLTRAARPWVAEHRPVDARRLDHARLKAALHAVEHGRRCAPLSSRRSAQRSRRPARYDDCN